MTKYLLPIFYSFYSYCITKIRIPLLFVGIIFIIWSSGYEFVRSPLTAEYIVLSIIGAIVLDLCITHRQKIWDELWKDEDDF